MEQIEELRRTIQFPKLESPPADFLAQMEAYAKEAPRPYDEATGQAGSKKVCVPLTFVAKVSHAAALVSHFAGNNQNSHKLARGHQGCHPSNEVILDAGMLLQNFAGGPCSTGW